MRPSPGADVGVALCRAPLQGGPAHISGHANLGGCVWQAHHHILRNGFLRQSAVHVGGDELRRGCRKKCSSQRWFVMLEYELHAPHPNRWGRLPSPHHPLAAALTASAVQPSRPCSYLCSAP